MSIGLDGGEHSRHLAALAQEVPDRPGDLRRRQRGGRDLIEKRLKQVMIAAVDHRDADRRPGETMNGLEPAESGADHDHVMKAHVIVRPDIGRHPEAPSSRGGVDQPLQVKAWRPPAAKPYSD